MTKASATGKSQVKKPRGGASTRFKPNDPATGFRDERINRLGTIKPRSQKELEILIDEVFDDPIIIKESDSDGNSRKYKMSELQSMLKRMARSRNMSGPIHLLERRFGKVAQAVELTGKDGQPLQPVIIKVGIDPDKI